jgi:hypothetical protein
VECTTHIEFVLSGQDGNEKIKREVEKYITDFFADYARNSASDFKRAQVRQGAVHEFLGTVRDEAVAQTNRAAEFRNVEASKLFSNVYLSFSNYVHAKYPEIMDLYGGEPEHFHIRGMRGTSKDNENLEILDEFITHVSLTLKLMAWKLNMGDIIRGDVDLSRWFRAQ